MYTNKLRKKCPYSEFFWSTFSRIQTEYGDIQSVRTKITPNTDTFHAVQHLSMLNPLTTPDIKLLFSN